MFPHMTSTTARSTNRSGNFEVIINSAAVDAIAPERDPAQWHQSIGLARQACARIFRDGGKPADALRTFGLTLGQSAPTDWSKAVCLIADSLCAPRLQRAA